MLKRYPTGLALVLALGARPLLAQDFHAEFLKACGQDDSAATRQVVQRWLKARPADPDAYVARFNYLLKQAEALEVRAGSQAAAGGIAFRDKKGKVAGTIVQGYRPDLVEAACTALRQGLKLAPDRVDMWFGLAKTYEITAQPAEEVKVLSQALATHAKGTPWRWRGGAALPEAEAQFWPESLEEYIRPYWLQEGPAPLETGRQLSALIVQYYPESSLGPFNLGLYYGRIGKFEQAYGYFQQADKRQPNDPMTLANLTKLATDLKRKPEAQQYLAQLQKLPDGRQAAVQLAPAVRRLR